MAKKAKKEKKSIKSIEGALVPGFLLLGLGIGMAMNQTAPGVLIGLGVGFIAYFIAAKMSKK
ncbi:TPA: hypothetical protein HA265_01970 [Candidatus Woesearchaeota archaeon]|nr:hypothetical protein [Candidatus Woesearchaeota archaeon]